MYFKALPLAEEKLGKPGILAFCGTEEMAGIPFFIEDPGPRYLPADW